MSISRLDADASVMGSPPSERLSRATPTRFFAQRREATIELVLLLGVLNWVLWTDHRTVLPSWARTTSAAILAALLVVLVARSRPDRRSLGLRPESWRAGLSSLGLATSLAILFIWAAGSAFGTIGQVEHFARWIARNWYLELGQQILLQIVLVPRLEMILGRRGAVISWVAAAIFAMLHAPNLVLMALTFPAGWFWCEWYRRYSHLLAVFASHVLLGSAALYCLNGPYLGNLRVGIGYLLRR